MDLSNIKSREEASGKEVFVIEDEVNLVGPTTKGLEHGLAGRVLEADPVFVFSAAGPIVPDQALAQLGNQNSEDTISEFSNQEEVQKEKQ